MKNIQKRLTLCRREDWLPGQLRQLTLDGDSIRLDAAAFTTGFICLPRIDSGENGFKWDRVVVEAELPEGSSLLVYAYTSNSPEFPLNLASLTGSYAEQCYALRDIFGSPAAGSGDFLLRREGRYLWLMLELLAGGRENPAIRKVVLWMAGDHMVDYLPAIYREDDVTYRLLSVFNSMFRDMENRIEALPALLDYESSSEELLRYMAGWMGIGQEQADADQLREWISTSVEDYETMYTVEGIRRTVQRLTGRDPILVEYHDVDPNAPDCPDPEAYRILYGEDPFRFFVMLDEDTFPTRSRMEEFRERMREMSPADSEMQLVLLKRRFQLGWHTYLGINSAVGDMQPIAIDENMAIHFDTMIGGQERE